MQLLVFLRTAAKVYIHSFCSAKMYKYLVYWTTYKASLWLRDLQCMKLTKDKKPPIQTEINSTCCCSKLDQAFHSLLKHSGGVHGDIVVIHDQSTEG